MTTDHKGYKHHPFDTQDMIVLIACAITTLALILILME